MAKQTKKYNAEEADRYVGLVIYLVGLKNELDSEFIDDGRKREVARELKESAIPHYKKVPASIRNDFERDYGKINLTTLLKKCDEILE